MIEKKHEFVSSPNSPNRCQASLGNGRQCPCEADPGMTMCPRHAQPEIKAKEAQQLRNYRLERYTQRVGELSDSAQIKCLREEIAILRMCMESILNQCKSDTELVIYSGRISDMVVKIEKLVSSCQRLELTSGEVFDKAAAMQLATNIVTIITTHVKNPDIVAAISNDILAHLQNTNA